MSIYDINYNNVIDNLLVIAYRTIRFSKWMYSLIYPIQYLRDIFFNNYVGSSSYIIYDGYTILNINDAGSMVKFPDLSVWMTTKDNININTYNPTIGQVIDILGDTIWIKIQDDFIGFEERTQFNNQKIMFEYLLNRYFQWTNGLPIYITTNDTSHNMFEIGQDDINTAVVAQEDFESLFFISETDNENENNNFTIYVPSLIATTLGSNYQQIISVIVDKYNYLSLFYNYVIY